MNRHLAALLWRLTAWRLFVLWCVQRGLFVSWMTNNTPLLYCLKEIALSDGDLADAAELHRVIADQEAQHG